MRPVSATLLDLFGPVPAGARGYLLARWLFLRAMGLIYYSAFFSLVFQIRGLIGPEGILPAGAYLRGVGAQLSGLERYWFAPTLLWSGSGNGALTALCWTGMIAALLLTLREPVLRGRGAGLRQLPIGWNAAGGWLHLPVFRAAWPPSWTGPGLSAFARQPVALALGMVPHLFRIGLGEDAQP
jgi:hypothetical protein